MKLTNRLAAALAAAVLLAAISPAAAFATSNAGSAPSSASSVVTGEPTAEPTAVPTAVPTAEPTPVPTPAPTPAPVPLKLTSCNIGTGAGAAFEAMTDVEANTSSLTLRVYYSGELPASVKTNEEVSIKGESFIDQNAKPVFDDAAKCVDISGLKYTGVGNKVTVMLGTVSATFTLTECRPAEPESTPAPVVTPKPDPQAAGLIIKSSSIGTESVNAGSEFTLKLTIYATTSGNTNAEDVVVSVIPGEGVTVATGSSSTYIGAMAPGTSKTVSFPMKALDSFTGGISTIAVSVTGSGAGSQTNISVPVVQPDRFEIAQVEMPQILTVGEEDLCSVVFVNKGRNPVSNLTVTLAGTNMATTSQSEYVGNLAAGTQSSVDFDIAGVEPGELKATITVQYEGSNGDLVTLTQEVSCVIEEASAPVWDDPGYYEEPIIEQPAPAGLPLWAKVLIGVAAVAAVIVVVVIVRKRKAKKAALEDDDEDI